MAALIFFVSVLSTGTTISANDSKHNITQLPCTIIAGGQTIMLDIDPKPVKAMNELTFRITVTRCNSLPKTLRLDLSMPDMQMGNNQVTLVKKNGCTWEGKGIIVKCMSGGTLWKGIILSDELHHPAFTFNVRK